MIQWISLSGKRTKGCSPGVYPSAEMIRMLNTGIYSRRKWELTVELQPWKPVPSFVQALVFSGPELWNLRTVFLIGGLVALSGCLWGLLLETG